MTVPHVAIQADHEGSILAVCHRLTEAAAVRGIAAIRSYERRFLLAEPF